MKQKINMLCTILLSLCVFLFVGCSMPSGYEMHSSCGCSEITEGEDNSSFFLIMNSTHFFVHNSSITNTKKSLCEYSKFPAPKRTYEGLADTKKLHLLESECFPRFSDGIHKTYDGRFYYCECRK